MGKSIVTLAISLGIFMSLSPPSWAVSPSDNFSNCTTLITDQTPADPDGQGCFVTGALTIPFKAELSGNRDVFGSASLAGFVGYDTGWWHNFTLIGFIGYSSNLQSSSGGSGSTNSNSPAESGALTYGGGFAFPIGKTFTGSNSSQVHIGAVVGFDHTASSSGYQYNDKPWVSVLIGTSF